MDNKAMQVVFYVEPADRGAGIMSSMFSAWLQNGSEYVVLDDIVKKTFSWYDNESNVTKRPSHAQMLEALLISFAETYDRTVAEEMNRLMSNEENED